MNAKEYEKAKETFDTLGGFKDSKDRMDQCETMLTYENSKVLMDTDHYKEAKMGFESVIDFQDSGGLAILCDKKLRYQEAMKLMEEKEYQLAANYFQALDDFEDSAAKLEFCNNSIAYKNAVSFMEEQNYEQATKAFLELGDFYDSKMLYKLCNDKQILLQYNMACKAFRDKKYYTAYTLFDSISNYSDSKSKAVKCIRKSKTKTLYKNKKYTFDYAPLIFHASEDKKTYIKIYTKKGKLVMSLFLNPGASLNTIMPKGKFQVKVANGSTWFGEKEMFGKEGIYYSLDTDLIFNERGTGYEITLYQVTGGNLGSIPEDYNGF